LTYLEAVWGVCAARMAVDVPFGALRNYLTVPNAAPIRVRRVNVARQALTASE